MSGADAAASAANEHERVWLALAGWSLVVAGGLILYRLTSRPSSPLPSATVPPADSPTADRFLRDVLESRR